MNGRKSLKIKHQVAYPPKSTASKMVSARISIFYWQKIVRESVLNEIKPNRFTELPVPVSSDMFFSLTAPSPITITVGKGTITVQ